MLQLCSCSWRVVRIHAYQATMMFGCRWTRPFNIGLFLLSSNFLPFFTQIANVGSLWCLWSSIHPLWIGLLISMKKVVNMNMAIVKLGILLHDAKNVQYWVFTSFGERTKWRYAPPRWLFPAPYGRILNLDVWIQFLR